MFLFKYHEDNLRQLDEERRRDERRNRLLRDLRELRGASPPFDSGTTGRLAATMTEARYSGPERRSMPCPEIQEAMTP